MIAHRVKISEEAKYKKRAKRTKIKEAMRVVFFMVVPPHATSTSRFWALSQLLNDLLNFTSSLSL